MADGRNVGMGVLNSSLDFTSKAWDKVFDAVDDKSFAERED